MRLKVGCCGYPIAMRKYFQTFCLVEVQSTFYNLPRTSTAEGWRKIAPEGFEFTMKAWQVVTHPAESPSWRRTRLRIQESDKDKYGLLRPTEQNLAAWNETMILSKVLGCRICVVQTPPSFRFSEENVQGVKDFFRSAKRDVLVAWEPRGTWAEHELQTGRLCRELALIHVVDFLRRRPSFVQDIAYVRLHGLNPREYDYEYRYTENDLSELLNKLRSLEPNVSEAYVLFNNVAMLEDAQRFVRMARGSDFKI